MLTNESPFAIKEAYVKLRTSLLFCMTADKERPCSTFAITSAKPSAVSYTHLTLPTILRV